MSRPDTSAEGDDRAVLTARLHGFLDIACLALDHAATLGYELGWPGTGADLVAMLASAEHLRDTTELPG